MKKEIAKAQQQYDLNKAAELQYGKLPQIQKQLEAEEERLKMEDLSLMHENVSEEEIARIILEYEGDYNAIFKAGVMGINSGTLESQRIAKEVINSQEVQNALRITDSIEKKSV